MSKSQETFSKKEKEKKRQKKKQDRVLKKEERKNAPKPSGLEDMIMYVDENGHFTDTPPDPTKKTKIKADQIEIGIPKSEAREEIDPIRVGRVEFFNDAKGYGFIKENETQEKYFVHINGCEDEIAEGNAVNFELERGMKGMNAVRVKRI